MRHFLATFTLRNGHKAQLDVVATDGCAAIVQLLDHFGQRLQRCSVRPAS
jgi:hypothetical protein